MLDQTPEIGLTFDDVLLVPRKSDFLPRDAETTTRLTTGISLNIPIVTAAMDTVTEGRWPSPWPARAAWASSTRT